MTIKPNDEQRSFGADRERQREVSSETARSAQGSNGENVARAPGASETGLSETGRPSGAGPQFLH